MTPEQLKASILQYAIQGKLVEQRPEEGTGEELYHQIQEEKQRLIKAGKIKKEKPLPEISEDEIPFDIPESWKWVRVAQIVTLNPKNDLADELVTSFVPMSCVMDGFRNQHTSEIKTWKEIKKGFTHFAEGDIGVAKITPCFQNRKSVIFRNLKNRYGAGTTELTVVRTISNTMLPEFLLWFFKTPHFITNGVKSFTGTAGQQRIHKDYLSMCLIPLPPLAEQHRIVAKIEEILPLVDRYAAAYEKLERFNAKFPEDMKKSILQYAIQGKLVEQRSEEGTGEELYQQIQEEKKRLIKEGKIKREKPLPEIAENEIPFDIPESWKWVYLLDVVEEKPSNGFSPKGVNYRTPVKNLTLTATTSGYFKADAFKYVDIQIESHSKYWLKQNDLLIQRSNSRELVGTSCIYTGKDNAYIYPDLMMRLRTMDAVDVKYIDYVLKSPLIRNYFAKNASGTSESMPKINQRIVSTALIPLPPLAEQERIVAKLEEILPLCERLK